MFSSYQEVRKALLSGNTTCKAVVEHYISTIKAKAHLNIFLEVYEGEALEQAGNIDRAIAAGEALPPLAGMVVGLKDVICHEGHGLQAASQLLDGFISQFSATAVHKLLQAGAIVIGRQNCDEFAMGSTNESSAFGPSLNSLDPSRVPGGSSGASAAAVAAGMCLASLGSDTGGSVRQPASFCGVVGLKPTYSRISRHGLMGYASSFDTIGIIAGNIPDTALLLEAIAGMDEFDATVSQRAVGQYTTALDRKPSKQKIGYIQETLESEGISQEVKEAIQQQIRNLREEGNEVVPVSFPLLDKVLPTYYILTAAEASTNLSRYDGVRYGKRAANPQNLEDLYKRSRSEGFGAEVRRRIMLGTFVLSASYYDAYFTKAQRVRRLIKEQTEELLKEVDFLISPTAPTVAPKIGQFQDDILEMYLADLFTVQASVAGIPAISVPIGKGQQGLPIGLQIMGKAFEEEKLLHFAQQIRGFEVI